MTSVDIFCLTVTSVKSARQVIDALNAEGQYIDMILVEVDLPVKKGMKLLKYIARDKELCRIPVISKSRIFIFSRNFLALFLFGKLYPVSYQCFCFNFLGGGVKVMSAQDEVSIVVKCLRLGAADYLVKPLRTNELLNLWTHMWRRRRMVCIFQLIYIVFIHTIIGFLPVLKHLLSMLIRNEY